MKLNSKSGFSLVELMVVVAIIGVLATVAVPNYMKFQAKAKQTSAKTELAGIYTAEKAFFVEYTAYHSNLPLIGYVPEGMTIAAGCPTGAAAGVSRNYNVGFLSHVGPVSPVVSCGTLGTDAVNVNRFDATVNNQALAAVAAVAGSNPGSTAAVAAAPFATFQAQARGRINGTSDDVWSMDENNVLTNVRAGL